MDFALAIALPLALAAPFFAIDVIEPIALEPPIDGNPAVPSPASSWPPDRLRPVAQSPSSLARAAPAANPQRSSARRAMDTMRPPNGRWKASMSEACKSKSVGDGQFSYNGATEGGQPPCIEAEAADYRFCRGSWLWDSKERSHAPLLAISAFGHLQRAWRNGETPTFACLSDSTMARSPCSASAARIAGKGARACAQRAAPSALTTRPAACALRTWPITRVRLPSWSAARDAVAAGAVATAAARAASGPRSRSPTRGLGRDRVFSRCKTLPRASFSAYTPATLCGWRGVEPNTAAAIPGKRRRPRLACARAGVHTRPMKALKLRRRTS